MFVTILAKCPKQKISINIPGCSCLCALHLLIPSFEKDLQNLA